MALGPDAFEDNASAPDRTRRLYVFNAGFLTQRRVRRILQCAGYSIHLGRPRLGDHVAIWGQSPTAHRGLAIARARSVPVVRIEDAFLRSVLPGRSGGAPLGLLIDHTGVHFDPARPSDLERLLAEHPLDDTALLDRARGAIARISEAHLSKYTAFDPAAPVPTPGYVLVIDQTRGDASVAASGADRARFLEMLVFAQEEHPGACIVIKTHPETAMGHRPGHFGPEDANERITLLRDPVSPHALFEGAVGVYTVSSQLGFEAIFAGHRPRVFGQPFYAGWGLTTDEFPVQRRQRKLTRRQLFAAAMILYPTWYDPYHDRLCPLEDAIEGLAAQTRAWREDHRGWVASGMSLWKRRPLQRFFGTTTPMIFAEGRKAQTNGRSQMVWASRATPEDNGAVCVEDGFLRSRGLGAELVPPLSLVLDDLGIYYDPSGPSRLEQWIAQRAELRPDQLARATALIKAMRQHGLSKYNVGHVPPDLTALPPGRRILIPGQVEDDASILRGAGAERTNAALIAEVRRANPDALLIYKPHPDVEAGLRDGGNDTKPLVDVVLRGVDPAELLTSVDEVWTMTSLLGFEALLRGVPVVTLGAPFYAGWGLTRDLSTVPDRRDTKVSIEGLVHASLIDYPRYVDPVTGLPCPVEVAVARLAADQVPWPGTANRLLSKLQGLFASKAHLWRRR